MTNLSSLDAIGLRHGTDKASNHHDFLRHYESKLGYLRDERFVLFEIGVFRGSSVKMWSEFFPNATVVGMDYELSAKQYAGGAIHIEIGNAGDPSFLASVLRTYGSPLVAVDDGSHRWDHQITALQTLLPGLRKAGHYILEDIDTSFEAHLRQAPFQGESDISAFDYLQKLTRVVVAEAALGTEKPYDTFIERTAPTISSIEYIRRSVILTMKG